MSGLMPSTSSMAPATSPPCGRGRNNSSAGAAPYRQRHPSEAPVTWQAELTLQRLAHARALLDGGQLRLGRGAALALELPRRIYEALSHQIVHHQRVGVFLAYAHTLQLLVPLLRRDHPPRVLGAALAGAVAGVGRPGQGGAHADATQTLPTFARVRSSGVVEGACGPLSARDRRALPHGDEPPRMPQDGYVASP
eukprot:scaffold396_cov339-Prasinococcus_capsulatus_cf.AAC.8